jgi:6-pyruvoyltetrahydropterin/6-carboxytetrahydropterin synthase
LDPKLGWVIDYCVIQRAFAKVHGSLDHRYLNDIDGLENPTSENLARWIWHVVVNEVPGLSRVVVRETARTGCVYRGE